MFELQKLQVSDGSWSSFCDDWRQQCECHDEAFDEYAPGSFSVLEELANNNERKAGVFATKIDGSFVSCFQVNVARLPKFDGPVMRVRHLVLAPDYDFGDLSIDQYALALTSSFTAVLELASQDVSMKAKHVKFHLRSPADRSFFAFLQQQLNESSHFETVQMSGSWLYIKKL